MKDFFVMLYLGLAAAGIFAGVMFAAWWVCVGTGGEYANYFKFSFMGGALMFVMAGIAA